MMVRTINMIAHSFCTFDIVPKRLREREQPADDQPHEDGTRARDYRMSVQIARLCQTSRAHRWLNAVLTKASNRASETDRLLADPIDSLALKNPGHREIMDPTRRMKFQSVCEDCSAYCKAMSTGIRPVSAAWARNALPITAPNARV